MTEYELIRDEVDIRYHVGFYNRKRDALYIDYRPYDTIEDAQKRMKLLKNVDVNGISDKPTGIYKITEITRLERVIDE